MIARADAEDRPIVLHPILRAGLLGRGIQESRSPRMHKAEGKRLGLSYDYRLFDFDSLGLADSELANVVRDARRDGYAGLNVTHPFKERVISILDDLSPESAAIGAVNTVVFRNGKAVGHNTDCWGFAESFRRSFDNACMDEVVLIGAGGAGMAVGRALIELGVGRLTIVDANKAKAKHLIEGLPRAGRTQRVAEIAELESALSLANGLVNATPVGMAKYPGMPVERGWLRPDLWVADIVYFPAETELLNAAKAVGCRTLAGTGMAIFQAVRAFELITGVVPDPDQMARHFWAA